MSRTPSIARSLASSSTRPIFSPSILPRRTLIGDTSRPRASDSVRGNTTSVDPRIFSGIPEFISKSNLDSLCEWQTGLWTRLQAEVRNNPQLLEVKQKWDMTGLDMTYLLQHASREPSLALVFNYASLLLNNSFFLETLHGGANQEVPSDYRDLESKVEAYAEGVVGGGWLWIVRAGNNKSDVDVVPSFASGTLLVTNRSQRGRDDLPVFGTPQTSEAAAEVQNADLVQDAESSSAPIESQPLLTSQDMGTTGFAPGSHNTPQVNHQSNRYGTAKVARGNANYPVPLAVLNLFEHSYLGERYGVWGRGSYARDWFRKLDWNKVQERASKIA